MGIYLDWGSNHYVVDHNLVYNVPVSLSLDLTNTGILLYNNTLAGHEVVGIESSPDGTGLAGAYIENNIFSGTWNGLGGVTDEVFTNNLTPPTPPQFVDPAASDYQLQPNSAAVGGGAVNQSFTAGYDPETSDIGAFSYGVQSWSAGISSANLFAVSIPAAPSGLVAASVNDSQITLDWQNNATSATSVVVQRCTDDLTFLPIVTLPAGAASYTDTPPVPGTYYYRVCAVNGSYTSGYSNSVTVNNVPLAAADTSTIQAVNFTPANSSGVTASGGVLTNCEVGNWAEYANVDFPAGASGTGTDTAINQLTVNYGDVGAQGDNEIQFSLDSPTAAPFATVPLQYDPTGFVTTTVTFYPNVIPAGSPILAGYHNVYITFGGTSGVNAANIAWFQIASMESSALVPPLPVDYSDTGPDALTGDGVKPVGGGAIGNCDGGKWVQYANMNFTAGINQFTVDYSPYSNGPNQIMVRLDSPTATPFATFTTPAITTWPAITVASVAVSGITPGLHDLYFTFTGGSGVCNIYSFAFSDSTPEAAPTNASTSPAPGMAMNITWTSNSSNETGYKIERSTDNETFVQVGQVGGNVTSFQDTGVSPGTTYYYRICAYSQIDGNTAYTNVASAVGQTFYLYWNGGAGAGAAAVGAPLPAAATPPLGPMAASPCSTAPAARLLFPGPSAHWRSTSRPPATRSTAVPFPCPTPVASYEWTPRRRPSPRRSRGAASPKAAPASSPSAAQAATLARPTCWPGH